MLNRFIDLSLLIKSQDVHPSDAAPEELDHRSQSITERSGLLAG
jgi:hypothetical protein